MTIQLINIGKAPNSGDGDSLRVAFGKINTNMNQLFGAAVPNGPDGALQYRKTVNLTDIATLGGITVSTTSGGEFYTTIDGLSWELVNTGHTTVTTLTSITSDGTQWIATANNGKILTSSDATTWSLISTTTSALLNSITTDGTTWVAVGDGGAIVKSTDLVTWSSSVSGTTRDLNSVVYSDSLLSWVAVGDTGTILLSGDGSSWTSVSTPIIDNLNSVTVYLNTVLTVGDGGTILTTQDGVNWASRVSTITSNFNSTTVATLDGIVTAFAVGSSGKIVTSIDAGFVTWTDADYVLNTTNALNSIRSDSGTLWVVGNSGTSASSIGSSTWVDGSITAGLDGSSRLTFSPDDDLLSVDADIIPATSDLWSLGNTTNKFDGIYLGNSGAIINDIAIVSDGSSLSLINSANGAPANLVVENISATTIDVETIVSNAANFYSLSADLFSANTFTVNSLSVTDIVADTVTANSFSGDGSNLTNLPVQSIIAGNNVSVLNVGGAWTISASGSGGGNSISNPSHLPLNSVQLADINGTFTSSSNLIFDTGNNKLSVNNGTIVASNFVGNLTATTITSQNANISGNLTAGNLALTGNVTVNTTIAESANLGNIHIWRSNIMEVGNDDFVINAQSANLIIHGANNQILNSNAKFLTISGGTVNGIAKAGLVTITGGNGGSAGDGGNLELLGGSGGITGGNGGNVRIQGGNSGTGASGGSITIMSGTTQGDPLVTRGSNIYIQPGNTVNETAGTLILQGANAVGSTYRGGNITITAGTGPGANGRITIGNIRWPDTFGLNNQVLSTDGLGNAFWSTVNANTPSSLIVSNLVNGTSNVQVATSGNVTFGVAGVANVATVTSTGISSRSVTTEALILGNATVTAQSTRWVKASTVNASVNQILWQAPAGLQVSTDFKIITFDVPASNRQSSQITSVTYGTSTSYSEYARTVINTVIADFTVDQVGGNIRLLVTPRVAHLINYTIVVSQF